MGVLRSRSRILVVLAFFGLTSLLCADTSHASKKTRQKQVSSTTAKSHSGNKAKVHTAVHRGKKTRTKKASWRRKGQQKIDTDRTREIQEALIREHYLDGDPSGQWDTQTQKALEKFQADNGWQAKTVPDSRALIKLGLGPDHEHLLNPESAMTSVPANAQGSSQTVATPVPADPVNTQPQR